MKYFKNNLWTQLFIIYSRYLIGGAFVYSSIVKIKGLRFTSFDGSNYPINSPFHFFETMYQSGVYWQFLGWGQLIAGLLLMTQRYSKLGALLFVAIISNIFVITISIPGFSGTPIVTGLMFLATLMLVIWDWDELKILLNLPPEINSSKRMENLKTWEITGLALFLVTVWVKAFNVRYDFFVWGICCFLVSVIGFFIGLKNWKKLKNNEHK
jgi:uncharacterized membrane protein YphA (DoxX/SURF4 family)